MNAVLITGASSGIGAEFARIFAAHRYNLVLVARNQQALERLGDELQRAHGIQVTTLVEDLSEPDAASRVYVHVTAAGIQVEMLINNAGLARFGTFADDDVDAGLRLLQLNIVALSHLTKLFLPYMIAQKRGKILNVASIAAFMPGPLMAIYYATKAYVLSFSEALANELRGTRVTVTALCPGPTHSQFMARAGLHESRLFKLVPVADASAVAQTGFDGMMRGRTVVIHGMLNWLLVQSVRIGPRKLVTTVMRAMLDRIA